MVARSPLLSQAFSDPSQPSKAQRTMSNPKTSLSISLNGEALLTQSTTLEDLLVEQGFADRKVATAHNGDFVPERARAGKRLAAGDRIEVVSARQGG